ncbi:uncharacterized protein A1O5_02478 [Cladophialophora psammophila CBS 110553]|uniref:Uncharacterized protein n=1 Tax=Cladophialophora psammophila CBS 110553 TaxID=1182543 RepID=W9XV91_9EURO|nr:uncharacterized protein A1O5_02478 [Cladophialophora psammophila CBS 110553]EXJ74184.1 hypothetical protein A1O5_02478 [Cladophialophora psammophila CBS 110553]
MKLIILICLAMASVTSAASNVCKSGIYELLSPLSAYPPAQSYCSAHYPPTTVTVSTTFISKKKFRFARATPAAGYGGAVLEKRKTSTITSHSTTTTQDVKASQWSSLLKTAQSIVYTFCQCIESHPTLRPHLADMPKGRSDNHHYDNNHNSVDNPDNHTIYDDHNDHNDHNDIAYRCDDHTLTPDKSRWVPPVSIFRLYLQRIPVWTLAEGAYPAFPKNASTLSSRGSRTWRNAFAYGGCLEQMILNLVSPTPQEIDKQPSSASVKSKLSNAPNFVDPNQV